MTGSPGPRAFLPVLVALLSLTTFAFAQSLYQAVAGNPEFVVLNQITHGDLWLIVACFNLLPAVVLALLWLALARRAAAAAGRFRSVSFLLLLTPFLLELHKRYISPLLLFHHNTALVLVPLAVAAWLVFCYRAEFERFLLVLSPVIVIFPGLFLWHAWKEVPAMAAAPASSIADFAAADTGKPHPPIFILVLDEFTRPALLDGNGNIDASRFPHFAELGRQSTWFANATANAEYTTRSIPVIVTGNFPHGNDASDAAYPDNLFRLLAPEYSVTIHEVVTRFCATAEYRCPDAVRIQQRSYLLKAVARLYLLRIAPKSVVMGLQAEDLREEQRRFQEFLDEITPAPGSRPPLQFMHLELPHAPYMLAAEGSIHEQSPGGFDPAFAGDTSLLEHLRHSYELQVQFVDGELGRFIDRLKQAGLYGGALIVIASDHGVSWKPEAPGRVLRRANADMILPVPLFIKLPGQSAGRVSMQDAQSIDLAPTIAAAAGVRVPWQVAGHDLFAPGGAPRQKVMIDASGKVFAFPPDFAESGQTAR
ncbi:MAG TPA: sulfatase-like hydrolase/transferase [Candidatus Binatia bacterium]|nr:sulfatase-like hydrolase/transferase [Candidatus Binatia bacterium]